ncbi:uncharacterized protein LOC117806163 isoform X2 [Notolabrus celidotus]|nr:uncharacterized protein LOC117806163 isoform X2 [Notolabrus celidotus]XP_034530797.1 uncharacterized protein LOC117806163 isoform X2 [Notolabrus celidotus]
MDQLAFKCMMCKMESSTDSESEISPRWSDTSTMGCASSAPESQASRRTLPLTHKPALKHGCYSLFLDPYDGSSEDSDESNANGGVSGRRTRQQGRGGGGSGSRFLCRSKRFILHHPASSALREVVKTRMRNPLTEPQHLLDVPMKCGSDSELWFCELDIDGDECRDLKDPLSSDSLMHNQAMDIGLCCQLYDSSLHTTRPCTPQTLGPVTPVGMISSHIPESSSERSPSPCNLQSLNKRKLGFPGGEVVELGQRKKQCVYNMEDSASEPC